jgi:hypothetical protein
MGDMTGLMMRCRLMMGARIDKNDPAGLLALKKDLELSDTQVRAVEQIALTARRQAAAILTRDQTWKLDAMAGKPQSMMEMHSRMEQMMMDGMMKEGAAAKE